MKQGVTPFGKMKAPRKPWENAAPSDASAQAGVFGDIVDREFPPLADEQHGSGAQASAQ